MGSKGLQIKLIDWLAFIFINFSDFLSGLSLFDVNLFSIHLGFPILELSNFSIYTIGINTHCVLLVGFV